MCKYQSWFRVNQRWISAVQRWKSNVSEQRKSALNSADSEKIRADQFCFGADQRWYFSCFLNWISAEKRQNYETALFRADYLWDFNPGCPMEYACVKNFFSWNLSWLAQLHSFCWQIFPQNKAKGATMLKKRGTRSIRIWSISKKRRKIFEKFQISDAYKMNLNAFQACARAGTRQPIFIYVTVQKVFNSVIKAKKRSFLSIINESLTKLGCFSAAVCSVSCQLSKKNVEFVPPNIAFDQWSALKFTQLGFSISTWFSTHVFFLFQSTFRKCNEESSVLGFPRKLCNTSMENSS